MEFGVFVQGYVGKRAETDPLAEHKALMEETEYVIQADKSGFKYAWASEHHFLDEYSHLSANDVFLGYLAHATERIHLGSGIFNPLAPVNHPVKVAEKVAMLDHLSKGRFEFGSGRGAGSHEILGFMPGVTDMNHTKEIWEETIAEFPKTVAPGRVRRLPGQTLVAAAEEGPAEAVRRLAPGDVVRGRVASVVRHGRAEGARGARLQRAEGLRHGVGAGAVQDGDRGRRAGR
ncbi:hypothetical protein SVIOM74S_01599 [Streptomyces violarus]